MDATSSVERDEVEIPMSRQCGLLQPFEQPEHPGKAVTSWEEEQGDISDTLR
jgi:hypothetical protein